MKKNPLSTILTLAAIIAMACPLLSARDSSEITPLLIGSNIPDVAVANTEGETVDLLSIIENKKTIVIFYRGGWCPYCNAHLMEIGEIEEDLLKLGYQIIAISPDSPERIKIASTETESGYQLYSDSSLTAANAFGIMWSMTDKDAAYMKENWGHDLSVYSGGENSDNSLPVPAIFITTDNAVISFQHVDPNFIRRIPGDLLLAAAKSSLDFNEH